MKVKIKNKSKELGLVAEIGEPKTIGKTFIEYLKWISRKRNLPYKVRLPGYPEGDLQYQDETGLTVFLLWRAIMIGPCIGQVQKANFGSILVFHGMRRKKSYPA